MPALSVPQPFPRRSNAKAMARATAMGSAIATTKAIDISKTKASIMIWGMFEVEAKAKARVRNGIVG